MELRRQITIIRRRLLLIVASVLVASGMAHFVSSSSPKTYEGQATLLVGQSLVSADVTSAELLASQRLSQTFARLATTGPLLGTVIEQLALPMRPEELRRSVSVQSPRDSTLITIVVTHENAQTAADIANVLADRLIAVSPAVSGQDANLPFIAEQLMATQNQIETFQADLDALLALPSRTLEQDEQIDSLHGRLVTLRQTYAELAAASSGASASLLTVVDPAVPAVEPSSPRVLLNTLLAGLFGLMVAVGITFLLEYLDDTIKGPDDVADTVDVPVFGLIPPIKVSRKSRAKGPLVIVTEPRSPAAEAYRTMRTNLEFASIDRPLRSLLVTSAVPREGKTTTSVNLAMAFAQAGKRVILLDADMRNPGVHRVFELPNAQGLTTLLRAANPDIASIAHFSAERNLRIITSGPPPPNPAELLGSQRMRDLLAHMGAESDLIVVDSPPLQAVTDAAVLAAGLDGALLVIDSGRTRRGAVRQARQALDRVGANVLGAALNRMTERATGAYYYRHEYGSDSSRHAQIGDAAGSQGH